MVNVPQSAVLSASRPLFEEGVIRTKSRAVDLKSHDRVRYVQMLRDIGVTGNVEVPMSPEKCRAIVELFDAARSSFKVQAAENATKYVSGKQAVSEVVTVATKHWFDACRKSALTRRNIPSGNSLN